MSLFIQLHSWHGTDHCLREDTENDGNATGQCCNDHTGCLYNDGHNGCQHPSLMKRGGYDSPLSKKERECLRCKKTGFNYVKLGPEHLCPDCYYTCRLKYS